MKFETEDNKVGKRIAVIATGGTIASKDMGNGLRPEKSVNDIIEAVLSEGGSKAEQFKKKMDRNELTFEISELFSIDSSDMRPSHWNRIGEEIARFLGNMEVDGRNDYEGIIILHGTDTMAYTAAALSVMFDRLPIPVVLTGSQLPAGTEGTDAGRNFCDAVRSVQRLTGVCGGVFIAFGGELIDGRYATKCDTDRMNAFTAVDGFHSTNIDFLCEECYRQPIWMMDHKLADVRALFNKINQEQVLLVKIHPGLTASMLSVMLSAGADKVLLELYGAGGLPSGEDSLLPVIEAAVGRGVRIYAVSQCLYHNTNLRRYEVGRKLEAVGVISLGSYSTEYALAYIMSL